VHLQTPRTPSTCAGCTWDDALPEVDAFLDRHALAQASHVFLIHGHGTGALKTRCGATSRRPPTRSGPSPPREQGGDGVTIVLLS